MSTQHRHEPLPNPTSTWHLSYKNFRVIDFQAPMGPFLSMSRCAWWHLAVQHLSSHHSFLVFTRFPSLHPSSFMAPTLDEAFSGGISDKVQFKIPLHLFCCSRSASLWRETKFPSSTWDVSPHLLPNRRVPNSQTSLRQDNKKLFSCPWNKDVPVGKREKAKTSSLGFFH